MFGHIYKNRLTVFLRTPVLLFWTLLFPIVLGTLFQLAFANLSEDIAFDPVPVAVVESEDLDELSGFADTLDSLNAEGEDRLIVVHDVPTMAAGASLLEEGAVYGIIAVEGEEPKLTVAGSGLEQTILETIINGYLQTTHAISHTLENDPASLQEQAIETITTQTDYLDETTAGVPDATVISFYSLIGMACLYGSMFGMQAVNLSEANVSRLGMRLSVSPVSKFTGLAGGLSAAFTVQFAIMLVVWAYLAWVLRVPLGDHPLLVLLLLFTGTCTGVAFGAFVGSALGKSESAKTAVIVGVTMVFMVLSGMMVANIKYLIQANVPVLAFINPLNLVTDALHSLANLDSVERYFTNLGALAIITVVLALAAWLSLRRKSYARL